MRILLILALCSRAALAWDDHALITRLSLKDFPELNEKVTYVSLDKALREGLSRFRARSTEALRRELKISKSYAFPTKLKEGKAALTLLDVVSGYADEPDWGPDQNLFAQYPELWNEDMKYVTERKGFGSQAFRHQFYPGEFRWLAPLATFQYPMKPLGEGPSRSVIFLQLAQDLFEKKQTYWGARFLAWSIHYMEDLFQPFHVSQTPSKRFISLALDVPPFDVEKTAEAIKHYHFAYEKWAAEEMKKPDSKLPSALPGTNYATVPESVSHHLHDSVVRPSAAVAGEVGSLCYDQFHPTKKKDRSEALVELTRHQFTTMASNVRAWVKLAGLTGKSEPPR